MSQSTDQTHRSVSIENLLPGMVIRETVEDPSSGDTLLEAGTELTETEIRSLKSRDIYSLNVDPASYKEAKREHEANGGGAVVEFSEEELESLAEDVLEDESEERRKEEEERQEFYDKLRSFTASMFDQIERKDSIDVGEIRSMVSTLMSRMSRSPQETIQLTRIRDDELYLYSHTINVTILSVYLARQLDFDSHEIEELGIGAMLHDAGMTKVPDPVLNKEGQLTDKEYRVIQQHPRFKEEMLKDAEGLSYFARSVVLQHHERMDGSGYPHGIDGSEISRFARLVAVTDSYDAMVSPRVYSRRKTAYEAMQEIVRQAGQSYDKKMARYFYQNMAVYPIGTVVELSNGAVGVVQGATDAPMRPRVKIILDESGEKQEPAPIMNLMEKRSIMIDEVLDEIDV
jgi:HD-GYP domain-containing protein (c-di-GMP phosphodiesterase class II)